MAVTQREQLKNSEIQKLRTKAALLDELLELIEDKYLGQMMQKSEKEKGIPFMKAKRLLR